MTLLFTSLHSYLLPHPLSCFILPLSGSLSFPSHLLLSSLAPLSSRSSPLSLSLLLLSPCWVCANDWGGSHLYVQNARFVASISEVLHDDVVYERREERMREEGKMRRGGNEGGREEMRRRRDLWHTLAIYLCASIISRHKRCHLRITYSLQVKNQCSVPACVWHVRVCVRHRACVCMHTKFW